MKPREEYDKEALLVVADLEQIGRNLFARRNIWFYLFMCVYICVACVRSHTLAEKRRRNKMSSKKCGTNGAKPDDDDERHHKMSGGGGGARRRDDEWAPLKRPLLFLGVVSLVASVVSYRKKRTNLFKMSYASTCVTLGPATVLFALPERDEKLEAMLMKNHRDDKEARFEKKKESVVDNDREDFERTKRKNTEEMLAEMRRVASSKS